MKDDPKKPYKAYVAAIASFLATAAGIWIADTDPFTMKEFVGSLITAGVGSGIVGGATYAQRNPPE